MFKVKLTALEHPSVAQINIDGNFSAITHYSSSLKPCLSHPLDPKEFRNLVLWTEDQKIRHYKIEDRVGLRAVNDSVEWDKAFDKYKHDLGCPPSLKTQVEILSWILGYAVKLEYGDRVEKFKPITASKEKTTSAPVIKSTNPFDNLDFNSKDFESGVRNLALKFDIPYHPDHLVVLQGISRLITNHLSIEALKEQIPTGQPYPIFEGEGFGFENQDMEKSARILRLLHIQDLRQLQTIVNETIVAVQNLTADPRTDTKLGKVGF